MQTWGIIGLGWLGNALNERLIELGHKTWGTHRESFEYLKDPFPQFPCDHLFLNTPPLTTIKPNIFVDKIKLEAHTQLTFISSTSVYGDISGRVDEKTNINPVTQNAVWLGQVESLLHNRYRSKLRIIRPGGLVGGERNPGKSIAGKKDIPGGNQKINLIHRDDLIEIIILKNETNLINAVSPYHPTKKEHYTSVAKEFSLPLPTFVDLDGSGKEVFSLYLEDYKWKKEKLR